MKPSLSAVALAIALVASGTARAANGKAGDSPEAFDWAGPYLGAHLGYAGGSSEFASTEAISGAPSASGRLDLSEPFDAFKGTGSWLTGLEAGDGRFLGPHLLLGLEADLEAPSLIRGTAAFSDPSIPEASFTDRVLLEGSLRVRLGYRTAHNTLVYGTGGLALTHDQWTRAQLAGSPPGGTAIAGSSEMIDFWRSGFILGAGVAVPLTGRWAGRLEVELSRLGHHVDTFPAGNQRVSSDLDLQTLRLGLDYRLGSGADRRAPAALDVDHFNLHGQTTFTVQHAFPFRAPYAGPNSLAPDSGRETFDLTLYAGFRPWAGGELWLNPEIDQGFGLSTTLGAAGFPSAEAYKFGASSPYARLHRAFLRQTVDLGGPRQKVEADLDQFAGDQTADRLVVTAGKFGVNDVFDTNKYAHDPRNDFLNWGLVDAGTWDYAADAWAFTYGLALEWTQGPWTLRGGFFDMSVLPNSTDLDPHFGQYQWDAEIERRYVLGVRPGKLALTGYSSHARMGGFADAIALAQATGGLPDTGQVRRLATRDGLSANVEQELATGVGAFARAGWASGGVEPFEFTDIDRTAAAGLQISGQRWHRPRDTVGIAGLVNHISTIHQAYLAAGGLGLLVGDGQLPHPGPERILETYYSLPVWGWQCTLDYQRLANPAYNQDRGPVDVAALRVHRQF